ncbi:CYTH domain-containing protein [Escherichia coli]
MGLRIRGENGRYEMTMKVAGRVTGGLHQRPEYNVALSEPNALPGAVTDGSLAERRIARRSRFPRTTAVHTDLLLKWLVAVDDSRIEIALDQGEVKSGGIC